MASLLDEWAREETTTTTTTASTGLNAYGAGEDKNLLDEDQGFDDDDGIDFDDDDFETDGVLVGRARFSASRRQQQQPDMFSLDVVEREVAR